jgi:hypothetical protein
LAEGLGHLGVVAGDDALARADLDIVLALSRLLGLDQLHPLPGVPQQRLVLVHAGLNPPEGLKSVWVTLLWVEQKKV